MPALSYIVIIEIDILVPSEHEHINILLEEQGMKHPETLRTSATVFQINLRATQTDESTRRNYVRTMKRYNTPILNFGWILLARLNSVGYYPYQEKSSYTSMNVHCFIINHLCCEVTHMFNIKTVLAFIRNNANWTVALCLQHSQYFNSSRLIPFRKIYLVEICDALCAIIGGEVANSREC